MEILKIPLSLVNPSPMNPRKTFSDEELQELADNIEKQGLLQPITVRPKKHPLAGEYNYPTKYEIICGERRYRAYCKLSEKWAEMDVVAPKGESYNRFAEIAAIVREMNDDEAFDAMITENLQRKDVDPIEEAFAFGQLIEKGKTAEEIALRFGKSVRFVQDRVKLNNLIPELMLAVKEDRFSLAGAMIISKLDQEAQQRYFKTNGNYLTRQSAQSYVNNLFLYLGRSLWFTNGDKDYTGGCDRSCAECPYNTTNHGCLFYEMKPDDEGKCTCREKYCDKQLAYMLDYIGQSAGMLVKKGEPLSFGRVVIGLMPAESYESEENKILKKRLADAIAERGYEVVDPQKFFSSKCYYDFNDERTTEKLNNGEAYRVLSLTTYSTFQLESQVWYFKKESTESINEEGTPAAVSTLLYQLNNHDRTQATHLDLESFKVLGKEAKLVDDKLDEAELKLLKLIFISTCYNLKDKYQSAVMGTREDLYNLIEGENAPSLAQLIRGYLQNEIAHADTPLTHLAMPLAPQLAAIWCSEKYAKAIEKIRAKSDKARKAIVDKLAALGYNEQGKKIE